MRFAPILDQVGDCIPSLYAADTVEAAIYETIFHDVPLIPSFKSVPFSHVAARGYSVLTVRRRMKLASLRAPDLIPWGVSQTALIGSSSSQYGRTAQWAKRLHDQYQELDGLVWTSNLCDPDSAYLLFGDRVKASDLEVSAYFSSSDVLFLREVVSAALRGGIHLSL